MNLQDYLIQLDNLNQKEERINKKREEIQKLLDEYSKERLEILIEREKVRQIIRGW